MTVATTDAPQAPSNGGGEIQPAAKAPSTLTLSEMLGKRRDLIAAVLPRHLAPERLIKLATTAVGRDPKLGRATALSIVNSVVKAAELGLDCSGTLGSAYLVPFENSKKDADGQWYKQIEAQLIIGYRGLIDLARRSGQIASIEARVVWKNDEFDFEYGLEPRLKHKPALDKEPGELRLVYAIAKLKDGATQVEVMTKAEIDKIRARSKSGSNDKSPWNTDYPEMSRKTVVKRLCKYLPLSVEIQEVIAADNVADPIDVTDAGDMIGQPSERNVNGMLKKVTNRPVSEGQTLEPDPDALDAAAKEAAALELLKSKSPSVQQQAADTLPSDNQSAENGDEGQQANADEQAEADAIFKDDAKAEKRCREQARDVSKIGRADFSGGMFKYRNPLGKHAGPMTPELWKELFLAITEKRFDYKTGVITPAS